MIVIALWSIFSDDIRLASTTKDADRAFAIVISIIFFLFLLEILIQCYYKEDYMLIPSKRPKDGPANTWKAILKRFRFGSFYFWLDLIATFSLVAEIPWIVPSTNRRDMNAQLDGFSQAGKALRAGARASKIVRVFVRLLKYARLLKMFQYTSTSSMRMKAVAKVRVNEEGKDHKYLFVYMCIYMHVYIYMYIYMYIYIHIYIYTYTYTNKFIYI
jgi:hypothetical protein